VHPDGQRSDPTPSGRPPTELIVEPTRIGQGSHTSLPGVVATLAVLLFLGLAIWKPWDRSSVSAGTSPRPSVGVVATPPAVTAGSVTPGSSQAPVAADYGPFPSNAALLAATSHEPIWGVRAVVQRPGGPIFTGRQNVVERWVALPKDIVAGSGAPAPLAIAEPDDEVGAIGVTTADDALPLDVHFWRENDGGPPERLAPVAIAGPDAGSWLWLADPAHATDRRTWQAGRYEIDVLLGPRIVRVLVTIPSSTETTAPVPLPQFRPPRGVGLSELDPGPFALTGNGTMPISGGDRPFADERAAWLGSAAGLTAAARVPSADVTGFGFLARPGETPRSIVVQAITPAAGGFRTNTDIIDGLPGGRRAILAQPTSGEPVPQGMYVVTASWVADGLDITSSWWVEVAPTIPASPPNAPLDAMSRWVGLLDQPSNDAREPLVFIADASGGTDECSPSTTITGDDSLFGIVVPPGVELTRLRMLPLDVQQSADIAIRYAPNALDRLTVVAVPPGGLPVRDYDIFLTLTSAAGETTIAQRVCVSEP
jgi:hypothetical protein